MAPSPVLADDDPVVLTILSLAGFTMSDTGELANAEGLTIDDAKRAAYITRDDLNEYPGWVDDMVVRADRDGWAVGTEIRLYDDAEPLVLDDAASQAFHGIWQLDVSETGFFEQVQLTGYNYDVYAAAATLCEMLMARLKMQFSFNDGSGTYSRSEKFNMVSSMAMRLWSKARPRSIELLRNDLKPGQTLSEYMFDSIGGGPWGAP